MRARAAPLPPFELEAQVLQQHDAEVDSSRRELFRWYLKRNYCAIEHVKGCGDLDGGPKSTFYAIAFELPFASMRTDPMRLRRLIAWTNFTDDTTHAHLRDLVARGLIAMHEAGWARHEFEVLALGGSLGLRDDHSRKNRQSHSRNNRRWDSRKNRQWTAEKIGSHAGRTKKRARARSSSSSVSGASLFTTLKGTADDPSPTKIAAVDRLLGFIEWFNTQHPNYNQVAGEPVKACLTAASPDAHVLLQLFEHFDDETLQAMVKKLWTIQASAGDRDATYIATKTNRSLVILREKAPYLHAQVLHDRLAARPAMPLGAATRLDPYAELWARVRAHLSLDRQKCDTYVAPCRIVDVDDRHIVITGPLASRLDIWWPGELQSAANAACQDLALPQREVVLQDEDRAAP